MATPSSSAPLTAANPSSTAISTSSPSTAVVSSQGQKQHNKAVSAASTVSVCASSAVLPTTIQVQLPLHQYFPTNDTATMQFYTTAAHSVNSDGTHSGVQVQVPVQVQVQQQYINPAIAYQQWFQQQIQVQQQQQAQQNQSGQQNQDGSFSLSSNGINGDATQIFSPYLEPGQTIDFHSLNPTNLNGQVLSTDGALSLSTLTSFANQIQQVHTSQGQTFMIAPSSGNNGSYVAVSAPQSAPDHHAQQQQHQPQQQQQPTPQPPATKKKGKGAKAAAAAAAAAAAPQIPEAKIKPPKVKGTPNAYALFYKETYGKLRSENPEWKASQIMAEAGKIWKVMNGAIQDQYRSQAESLVQQHQLLHANTKSGHKKQKNAQKRPMTAYQLFIREHFGSRPAEVAQMHAKDFLLRLSVQWKALTVDEKKVYQERAKAEKVRREAESEAAIAAANGVGMTGITGVENGANVPATAMTGVPTPDATVPLSVSGFLTGSS